MPAGLLANIGGYLAVSLMDRPSVVEKIMPLDGEPVYSFEPEVVGQLPV